MENNALKTLELIRPLDGGASNNANGYYKVPKAGVGPDGKPLYDVYGSDSANPINLDQFHAAGLNIDQLQEQKTPMDKSVVDMFNNGAVTTGKTPAEIQAENENKVTKDNIAKIQSMVMDSLAPSADEKSTLDEITKIKQGEGRYQIQEEGRDQSMGLATGRITKQQRDAAILLAPLEEKLTRLSTERGNVATKAKIALDMQAATLPTVVKTEINSDTGEVISIERDPLTGVISSKVVGTVQVPKKGEEYVSTSQDVMANGAKMFTGITKDGKVVRKEVAPPGSFHSPSSGSGTGAKLTLSEALKYKLPTSLVGKSEEEIGADLNLPMPPQWFVKANPGPLSPERLKTLWTQFQSNIADNGALF